MTQVGLIHFRFNTLSDSDFREWFLENVDDLRNKETKELENAKSNNYKDINFSVKFAEWIVENQVEFLDSTEVGNNYLYKHTRVTMDKLLDTFNKYYYV